MKKHKMFKQSGSVGQALAGSITVLALLWGVASASAQNLIPANAGFEDSSVVVASPLYEWPTFATWSRSGLLNPYTDSSNPQSGTKNVVLYTYTTDASAYFGLTFVGQVDPLGGPASAVANLPAITLGQEYTVSFWANRWVDVVTPNDIPNKGYVNPASISLADARLTLQLYTTTGNDLSGGGFMGDNLAFNPVAGGGSGAWTQGEWTQYSTTFTADKTGYLELLFKVKNATQTGYGGAGVVGVKYGLDNVSVMMTPVPEPSSLALGFVGIGVVALLRHRKSFQGICRVVPVVAVGLAAFCGPVSVRAQNLIPANAGFEDSSVVVADPLYEWPTFATWCRGYTINPYTDSSNPQSGSKNLVLYNYTTDGLGYFSLTYVGQADPLGGPASAVANLVAITNGQRYLVTFWANRWVDVVTPNDIPNKGYVNPASTALPAARLTLQLYTSTGNDLSGGGFLGDNLVFNPEAGGSSGAWTQGAWTQCTATFTADKTGYLGLFFKVKNAAQTWYGGAGAVGVKYGLDNVSVTAVPPPATPTVTLALHSGIAVTGSVDAHYQVEYATALAPTTWLLLQDIPSLPTSPFTVYDPSPATQEQRYYRAVLVP